jgi:hypothetical protein
MADLNIDFVKDVIYSIYDAALNPDKWSGALADLFPC